MGLPEKHYPDQVTKLPIVPVPLHCTHLSSSELILIMIKATSFARVETANTTAAQIPCSLIIRGTGRSHYITSIFPKASRPVNTRY